MGIIWIIKKVIYFVSKRGQNSEISCILKVYIIFRFFIKILYVFLIDFAENFPLYVDRFPPSHRVKQIKLLDQMGQIPKFGSFYFSSNFDNCFAKYTRLVTFKSVQENEQFFIWKKS